MGRCPYEARAPRISPLRIPWNANARPTQDPEYIERRIPVAVVDSPAYGAGPSPYGKRKLIQDMFAYGTCLGRGVEPWRLDEGRSQLRRHMFQNTNELCMTQIAHFATPSHLHRLYIQVFPRSGGLRLCR